MTGLVRAFSGAFLVLVGLPFIAIGIIGSFIFDMIKEGFKLYMDWTR